MDSEELQLLPIQIILPLHEAREESWYLNFDDARSPHDAWLKQLSFSIDGQNQDEERCSKNLQIVLLGSYHNGTITLTYRNVRTYDITLKKEEIPGMIWGRHDWIEDFLFVTNGLMQHRIHWEVQKWLIEATEIVYEWNRFPQVH